MGDHLFHIPIRETRRRLPHWTCDTAVYWITFRMADSLPQHKLAEWREERDAWLRHNPEPWNEQQWREYSTRFEDQLEQWLNAGYGSQALARPDVQAIVRSALLRFDGERLHLHACVIMPNHVHLLIEPIHKSKLSTLMKGIKGASARKANQAMNTSGQFWMDESYDHIVRSERQYHHFQKYIENNPAKANLAPDKYWLYLPNIESQDPAPA